MKNKQKGKLTSILLLLGAGISVLSVFLPWGDPSEVLSPFWETFKEGLFKDPRDGLVFFLLHPQFLLGIIIMVAVFSGLSKRTYWLCLAGSLVTLLWNVLQIFVIVPAVVGVFGFIATNFLGQYAAIAGPAIILVGLIFYKFVDIDVRLKK